MPDKNTEFLQESSKQSRNPWVMGPKEFIFRYLHYLPWVIFSIAIVMILAYIKIRYTTQIFRVQSSLLIKNDRDADANSKNQRFEELFMSQGTVNLNNEMEMLRSRPVLQRVAKDLSLQALCYNKGNIRSSLFYPVSPIQLDILTIADSSKPFGYKVTAIDNDKFYLNEDKRPINFGQIIEKDGNSFRLIHRRETDLRSFSSLQFEIYWLPLADAANNLISSLKIIQSDEQSTILALSFEGENVNLGKDVLNTIMAVYDSLIIEDKNKISSNSLHFINRSLFELNDTLRGLQGGLRSFMVQSQIFDIDEQSKVYLDKAEEANKLKNEQDVRSGIVDFLLKYIADKKNVYELVPTNLGIEEPALGQMIIEYNRLQLERDINIKTTSTSNQYIIGLDNSLDKLRRNIYQALLNVKQAYDIASENLNKQVQLLYGNITSLPGKSMKLLNIERQQKILEDLYSFLLQKKLETSISSAATVSNSKVIEPAFDTGVPISPDKKKTYTLYFLFGILIPVGIIAVIELFRDKVNSREDVEKHTSAPVLGEIGHSKATQTLVVTQNNRRLVSEQFRVIRTNLQYINGKKEKPVIMVTSSFSGEGKSFISTNMGAVMALSGKKTVIMEFDIRKPKIISGLDLKRKQGITNFIIGKAEFDELLVKVDGVDNLYVIPCGPIPPNPAEILLDERLDELMEKVIANFDCVIMDTAPIGLVSDAMTLGKYADCTLYIIRQRHTFRRQLRLIEELYQDKKLPSLCLLLNDVKVEGGYNGAGYYGGYGYYGGAYGYGAGYFEEDQKEKSKNIFKKFWNWMTRWFR